MTDRWDLIGCEPFSNIVGGLTQEQKHIIYENNYYELQKYKKLEEQIGCPLEVFFKLVKQVKINFNGTMSGYFVFYNLLTKRFEIRNEETMDLFPLTDYKKKFWLKEDKSE